MGNEGLQWPKGTVIWWLGSSDDAAIEEAKQWIRERGYTRDTVKLLKKEGELWVEVV